MAIVAVHPNKKLSTVEWAAAVSGGKLARAIRALKPAQAQLGDAECRLDEGRRGGMRGLGVRSRCNSVGTSIRIRTRISIRTRICIRIITSSTSMSKSSISISGRGEKAQHAWARGKGEMCL